MVVYSQEEAERVMTTPDYVDERLLSTDENGVVYYHNPRTSKKIKLEDYKIGHCQLIEKSPKTGKYYYSFP